MFKIKELHLKNFRSWESLSITDFDSKGLCGIIGINGSGKSSIRQALEYLLIDRTSDDLPLDELPRNKDTECYLSTLIQRDDDEILITKYRNSKKHGNQIEISVNGVTSLTCKNRADSQKNIDKLFNINSDLLAITTIFTQNSTSFTQAKESERKDILYGLVDLTKYQTYRTNASDYFNKIKKDIEKNEQEVLHLEKSCIYLKGKILELEEKDKSYERERLERVASCVAKIKELKESFKDVDVVEEIEEERKKFIEIDKEYYEEAKSGKDKLIKEKQKIVTEIEYLNKQKEKIGDGVCPVLRETCDKLVERRDKVLEEIEPTLKELQEKLEEKKTAYDMTLNIIKDIEKDLENNKEIERRIFNLEKKKSDADNHNNIVLAKISSLEEKIKEISSAKENPYSDMIKENIKELNTAEFNLSEVKDTLKELNEESKYAGFWMEGFGKSGIPNMKIEGILESIEMTTNNYLAMLGGNLHVELSSQSSLKSGEIREKIEYKVFHPDKSITNIQSFSGGERQRVKVADLLSFNDLFGKFNILFLDEVLELSLDDSGKESVLDLLRRKASEMGSLYIVSHDDSIKDRLDSTIQITKKEGVSKTL